MKALPDTIRDEFVDKCHWVLSKTSNKYSAIPVDQAHEQENRYVKSSGGCIGLTENPIAFRRWMLSGPELSRLQKQFEEEYLADVDPENPMNFQNHEQGPAAQKTFQGQVRNLGNIFRKMGNPFLDEFKDLVTLDSRNCVDESVVTALRNLENIGKTQYKDFVKNVLEDRTRSISDPIKRNNLALFKKPQPKVQSAQGKKIKVLQNNVALFGQLYISMQSRDSDLKEFFAHEIQSFPPSLSDFGKLHLPSTKSELLKCIEPLEQSEPPKICDCKVLDGAVIVHCLPTAGIVTFNEYAARIFIPHLEKQLQDTTRLDVVWDTYIPGSLKEATREKRGKGVRRKVSGQTKMPSNWMDFLRDPENKKELFAFLTSSVAEFICPPGKTVYITSGESVICIGANSPMPNCNHEETDTRVVAHVMHALDQDRKTIVVRTVDTDVVIILVGAFHNLTVIQPLADIWVAFGMGKHYRFYSINALCSSLGAERSHALPVFHALSGCDTTSAFKGKGKKSAWHAWQAYNEVTETFSHLARHPFEVLNVESHHFNKLERLIVVLYDKASASHSVNETRKELFCQRNTSMDRLPPTQNALLQHIRRAVYQAGVWTTSIHTLQVVPSPQDYGWTKAADSWAPIWMTIPEASRSCRELIRCSCKGNCTTLQLQMQ